MKGPLGRIEKLQKGNDGIARVVHIKTAYGSITRAIHRLAPLPPDGEIETDLSHEEPDEHQHDNVSSPVSERRPRKKVKLSAGAFLLSTLCVSLLLPIVSPSPVQITQFKPEVGMHFD